MNGVNPHGNKHTSTGIFFLCVHTWGITAAVANQQNKVQTILHRKLWFGIIKRQNMTKTTAGMF